MNETVWNFVSLLGRICLVAIFFLSGLHKITDPQGTQQYMAAMGMQLTSFFLVGAIILELVGAILILIGYWTRLGVIILLFFMIPATMIFHTNFGDQIQFVMFMKNLSMIGGLLMVLSLGPGGFSLDARKTA